MSSRPPTVETPAQRAGDARLQALEATMARHQHRPDALIEVLHCAQGLYGYLPAELLRHVAARLQLPPSRVYGVASFYHFFTLAPPGAHSCVVCLGTACFVRGAAPLLAALEREMGLAPGATSRDGALSLGTGHCLSVCGLAPVVIYDGEVAGHQSPALALQRVRGWRREPR